MPSTKLTVIRCAASILLTKRHTANGTESYGDAKWYSFNEHSISNLSDLETLLQKLRSKPHQAVLTDAFIGATAAADVTHIDEPVFRDGKLRRVREAFEDTPQGVFCVDIDGWLGSPAHIDPVLDPEACIQAWVELYLPDAFQNVDFIWQVSSSAGMPGKAGLRAHVWFWLAAPASKDSLKDWATTHFTRESAMDAGIFNRVRIHYTADPIFEGVDDPVPARMGRFDSMVADEVDFVFGSVEPLVLPRVAGSSISDDADDAFLRRVAAQPPLGLTEDEARDAIFALPYDEWVGAKGSRPKWIEAGMALHHEFQGDDVAWRIWSDWSKQAEELWNERDAKTVWKSFRTSSSTAIKTMASILKVVKAEGADFQQLMQKLNIVVGFKKALLACAEYDLNPIEIDTIIPILLKFARDEGMKPTTAAIKATLKKARQDHEKETADRRKSSLEDWLAGETLRLHYEEGEHLIRFAKGYWFYDKGFWRMLDAETVGNRVYQVVTQLLASKTEGSIALRGLLDDSGRADTLNALVNAVSGIVEKRSASDDSADPMLIREFAKESIMNCRNGELVFEQAKLRFRDHDPANRLTSQLACDYDPDATCPIWDKTMQELFANSEDPAETISHLYEVMGYLLQTKREFASWVLFFGKGSNGKSLVAATLQNLLGSNGVTNVSLAELNGNRKSQHAEAGLVGIRLLIDDDFEKGAALPDGIMKKLSEGKMLTANPKHTGTFNFVATATPMILANHWPRTLDNSYGLVRRALIFHFKTRLPDGKQDIGLGARIREKELSGVLNHLIAGWHRLMKRGAFKPSYACEKAKLFWLGKRNVVATFLSEFLEFTENPYDRVPAIEVWQRFRAWAEDENAGTKQGKHTFYEELQAAPGVEKYMRNGQAWFRGVKLRPSQIPDPFDDEDLI